MKPFKRVLALLLSASFAVSGLVGCGKQEDDKKGENQLNHITVATALVASTFDLNLGVGMGPYAAAYEGLYRFDENEGISLGLAEKVDISADGLTYTYTIRDNAYYSDGKKVTAQDFEYSWKRLANPSTAASYGYLVYSVGIKNAYDVLYNNADPNTLGVKATDEHTLVVEFDSVLPYLEKILVFPQFYPIKQEVAEVYGDQFGLTVASATPSAGPLYLTAWNPETGFTYEKNQYYYNADKIETDSVEYKTVTDATTGLMLWQSGQVDYVGLSSDTAELYENDPAYENRLYASLSYITPNIKKVSELQNLNLRKALALSFDKDAIADNIVKAGAVAGNFAVPEKFAFNDKGVTFRETANQKYLETNKEQAKNYWETAKKELSIDSLTLELSYWEGGTNSAIVQFIKSEYEKTLPGLTITLKNIPYASRVTVQSSGDFQLFFGAWNGDYDDASTYLDLWIGGNYYNYGGWKNKTYDELIEASKKGGDSDERIQKLIDAEKVLLDDVGIIPVVQPTSAQLINPDYKVPYSIKGYLWQYAKKVK